MSRRTDPTQPQPAPEPLPEPQPQPTPDKRDTGDQGDDDDGERRPLPDDPPPTASTGVTRPVPTDPSFGLSAGEAAELETRGVTNSPFTGERRLASEHGITPATDEAKQTEERARQQREARRAGGSRLRDANAALRD